MKRLKKNKRKLNNSGLTLIEVLIAMTLLTIAIVPMMQGFIKIGQYGEKGRNLQQATSIAQTAMENCKAYNITDIKTSMTTDGDFFDTNAPYMIGAQYASDQDLVYFINNMTVDGRNMGMSISLSPIMASKQDITKYENCNPRLDGIFVHSHTKGILDGVESDFYDIEQRVINNILGAIATNVTNAPGVGTTVTADEVRESLFIDSHSDNFGDLTFDRQITITAETDASGYDEAKVKFVYTATLNGDYIYTLPDGNEVPASIDKSYKQPVDAVIYSNNNTKTNGGKLERIFFYYYPAYNDNTYVEIPFTKDSITIDTTGFKESGNGKNLDVYLIKQKLPGTNNLTIELAEEQTSYKNYVEIKTAVNGSQMGTVNLYHNYNTNIGDGGALAWPEGFGDTSEFQVKVGDGVNKGSLVSEEKKTMMYNVKIKMYTNPMLEKNGNNKYEMTGEELLTLDGTKINW